MEYGALAADDKGWFTALAFALSRLGHEAVVVFFVLSGYLVGGRSLQRAIEGRFDVPAYWLDRVTRVYVPLIPVLGLTALVVFIQGHQSSMVELLVNLAGLQGAGWGGGVWWQCAVVVLGIRDVVLCLLGVRACGGDLVFLFS